MPQDESRDEADDALAPPNAKRVAKRAIVLGACVYRSNLEHDDDKPSAARALSYLVKWLSRIDARAEFEPLEWNAVSSTLSSLNERQRVDLDWRAEGWGVLAWALGRYELPPYDQVVKCQNIADATDFLNEGAKAFIETARLRPREELEWLSDLTLTLHWRLREHSIRPRAMDFVAFARSCRWAIMPIDDLRIIDNDLAIDDVAINDATYDRFRQCLSIASERHWAANWLMGQHELYSDITCDT